MQDNNQNNNPPVLQDPVMPIVDPVLPFLPKMENPNKNMVSVGGVEGGAQIKVESISRPAVEVNTTVAENEKPVEMMERADVKEPKSPVPAAQPVIVQDVVEKKEEVKPAFEPKLIGHKIEPELYADVNEIRVNAGKGDPSLARTAIFLLLERLLKQESK